MNDHWLARPRTIRRLWQIFIAILVLTVLAQLVVKIYSSVAVETIFGFNAAYGFLACAALILIAKGLGVFLKRPDTYYRD